MASFVGERQRRFIANSFLILLPLAALVSGCNRSETTSSAKTDTAAYTPAATKYLALERFETKRGAFELGIAPCTAEACVYEVRWLEANKLVSSIAMPVAATDQKTQREVTGLDWGADPGLQAWATGEESAYVSTVARPVNLDAETVGLLVTQHYGFDHLKRLHRLVVLRNGKLAMAWDFDEGAGPAWSATAVLATEPAGRVALFYGFYNYDTPSKADQLGVTRLRWDNTQWQLIPDPGGKVATVLTAGSFDSPGDARKFKTTDTKGCLSSYMVLSSNTIKTLPQGRTVLGKVFSLDDRGQIELDKKALLDCGVKLKLSVVDITSTHLPYEMRESN
jgi:hypothetical protein